MGLSLFKALFLSFVATLGFGILLHAPKRALVWASLTGMAANGCYLIMTIAGISDNVAIFIAALGASVLAELLARRKKMAATVFITLSIIPLVPGLALYRAMASFAGGESDAGLKLGVSAMISFLMIALGVALGSFIVRMKKRAAPSTPPPA